MSATIEQAREKTIAFGVAQSQAAGVTITALNRALNFCKLMTST